MGTGLKTVHYGAPPPDFAVPAPKGTVAISQMHGKPLVINFWATWCPPCTNELPYFMRLQQEYGDRVRIVMVDWNEEPSVAASYLKSHGIELPLVADEESKIYAEYSLTKVPDTVVVAPDGKVTYVSVGGLSWEELEGAVSPLLAK